MCCLHKLSPLDWHQMLHVNYRDNFVIMIILPAIITMCKIHKKPYRTSLKNSGLAHNFFKRHGYRPSGPGV